MDEMPVALLDRRLTRFLFKLVHGGPDTVYVVPTRRFLTLALVFGRIGFPRELLVSAISAAGQGRMPSYRHPYEIPGALIVSMYAMSLRTWLDVLDVPIEQGLLTTYHESPPDMNVPRFGLGNALPAKLVRDQLAAHLDTRDRQLGFPNWNLEEDATGYESLLAIATNSAATFGNFPALMLPELGRHWLEATSSPLAIHSRAESELLARLPCRLLNVQEIAEICNETPVASLRQRLAKTPGDAKAIENCIDEIIHSVSARGIDYRAAIKGEADFSRLALVPKPEVRCSKEALEDVLGNAPRAVYRALAAAEGIGARPALMLVPGFELWLAPFEPMALVNLYSTLEMGAFWHAMDSFGPS